MKGGRVMKGFTTEACGMGMRAGQRRGGEEGGQGSRGWTGMAQEVRDKKSR